MLRALWLTLRARLRAAEGRVASGRLDLDLARSLPSAPPLLDRSIALAAGDLAAAAGDWNEAVSHWKRALALVRNSRERDLLLYRLHLATRRVGGSGRRDLALLELSDRPEYAVLDRRFAPAPEPRSPASAATRQTPPAPSPVSSPHPRVLPRVSWHARPVRPNHEPMTPIHRITVHHDAIRFDRTDVAASAQRIRNIQRYHQEQHHWADIAYHFVIDRAGRVWQGRELRWQGAHAGDHRKNRGNIGICLLGDYRVQEVTPAQRRALFALLDDLRRRYGIPADAVYTHAEIKSATACPGAHLAALVRAYRSSAAAARTSTAAR